MEQKNNFHHNFTAIANKMLNNALIIFGAMSVVALVIGTTRISYSGWSIAYVFQNCIMLVIIASAIFRKKLVRAMKTIVLLSGLLIIFVSGLYHFGFLASGKVLFLIIPVLASFAFSSRTSFLILMGFAGIYFGYCYLWTTGILTLEFDANLYVTKVNSWLIDALDLIVLAFGVLVTMHVYTKSIKEQFAEIEQSTQKTLDSECNYRQIFDASSDGILIYSLEDVITDTNHALVQMFNYPIDMLHDKRLIDLCSPKSLAEVSRDSLNALENPNATHRFEWLMQRASGQEFWVDVSLKQTNIGGYSRIMAIMHDIDDKKQLSLQLELYRNQLVEMVAERTSQLEDANAKLKESNHDLMLQKTMLESTLEKLNFTQSQLIQTEKMASLGVLTAGVAHEINNSLNFIQSGVFNIETAFTKKQLLAQDAEIQSKIENTVERMKIGVKRVSGIVTSLNQFSHTSPHNDDVCSIHAIIDDCLLILNNQLKNIELEKQYTSTPYSYRGNEGKLHQVFLNILINAVQSIENSGTIQIITSLQNSWFQIEIIDSGVGIAPEILNRIFDPFFTTKTAGKGTGLGLSIVYSIIKEHNGVIDYTSELNKGTKVVILLPLR